MTRAAIYARVSKIDKDDPKSIPTQRADCRALAEEIGADVVGEFVDKGRSGYDPKVKREQYEAMLKLIGAGGIDCVITQDVDRLFRQDKERVRFDELTKPVRMDTIRFTDGSAIDLATAKGREAFRDAGSKAEAYADRLSEKVQRKHRRIAGSGLPNGGQVPFGYDRVRIPDGVDEDGEPRFRKTLVVNEAQADAIRDACAAILSGETLRGVTRQWNAAGFKTGWGRPWQAKAVRTVLLSGRIVGLRDRTEKDPRTGKRSRLDPLPADWEPIVSKDSQAKVRRLLSDPTRGGRFPGRDGRNTSPSRHLLSGLLVCGTCGRGLIGQNAGLKGNRFLTYTCLGASDHPTGGRPRIRADRAEAFVIDQADGVRRAAVVVTDPAKVSKELRDREAEVQGKMAKLAEMLAADAMSAEQFAIVNRPLVEELETIRSERDAAAAPTTTWADVYGGPTDPNDTASIRDWLDRLIVRAVLKPAGRSKFVAAADRIEIVWREGVTAP